MTVKCSGVNAAFLDHIYLFLRIIKKIKMPLERKVGKSRKNPIIASSDKGGKLPTKRSCTPPVKEVLESQGGVSRNSIGDARATVESMEKQRSPSAMISVSSTIGTTLIPAPVLAAPPSVHCCQKAPNDDILSGGADGDRLLRDFRSSSKIIFLHCDNSTDEE
nr:PREDICTED: uncharacterized protein LOC106703040 [Latimeria chalumnae]|eukprot:XP_014342495.1 PREDICTED: uncharacterized protein LOC106703040 [Latimeria chalumnae]